MRTVAMAAVLIGLAGCATADREEVVQTEVEVTMNCRVAEGGSVEDCRVTRERPVGYGMAAEALIAAERGQVSVQPVGGGRPVSRVGSRTTVSMFIPIDSDAVARSRRIRTEVSEPRLGAAGE